jgi:two-component system CitB family sensor kinase
VALTAFLSVKAAQARELGIAFEVRQPTPSEATVPNDLGTDLITVIGNLVDNSIEACGLGDHIEVTAALERGGVRITIDDSGPGVPDPLRSAVFTEGMSTKSSSGGNDPQQRRGIGLALVRRVVERRRGSIDVSESPLGGARFSVTLPVRAGRRRPRAGAKARA